jgi:hypothetical protein
MEIAVLSDIAIASENAEFQDVPIFPTVWFRATWCTLCGRSCSELTAGRWLSCAVYVLAPAPRIEIDKAVQVVLQWPEASGE